ncbi:hypothetical protein RJ639_002162 [Escallonia herrerae]|uniref:Retrotransposon Copia-like N-terminal domain-containing protein n=1 Tax=Escallonia herrerae TaxID=1293975 RepID=A0AA88XJ03_9ASTE|nr:hypothetical protein RJ639_002162 [Escallonia herrerae]
MGERTPSTRSSEIEAENSLLADLTSRLSQIMDQTPTAATHETLAAPISIKLDDTNYGLWFLVVEMYISGKDKLGYINGDLPQPQETNPSFRKWMTENTVVKSWLINSVIPKLISNYIRFPTVKAVWDAIATTYFDGADTLQAYDLKQKVTRMRQGEGSIETYYNNLQGLWREIDFLRPNPMKCEFEIKKYNSILHEDRVYIFLDGLDDRLDKIRGDVLQLKPFPMVEQAHAHHDLKAKKKCDVGRAALVNTGDTAAAASTEPQLSLIPQQGVLLATANTTRALDNPDKYGTWNQWEGKTNLGETFCEEQNMWEGWHGFDNTIPAQCEEVTIDANKGAQLLSQEAHKTQSGVMEDDVTGSICGQEQSIQSTEEEQFLLPNSKSSPGKGLMFRKHHHLDIDGYTDADWAGNTTARRSTSAYFTFVGKNLVIWRSKKLIAEAEFRGMAKGLCELLRLKRLLAEIGHSSKSSMNMFCDNKSAIQTAENLVQRDRTKHVEVDQNFIKEKLEVKIIRFPFVKSEEQLADILTKAVPSKVFHNSLDKLNIRDICALT